MLSHLQRSAPYRFYQKYTADQAGNLAILIAWTGLLSMFPLALALVALIGLLIRDPRVQATVGETIVRTFPPEAAAQVEEVLQSAKTDAGELGVIGLAGLIFSGSALFGSMATAFNRIYRVPGRGVVVQRLMAMGMILLCSALVVISLLASALASALLAAVQGALPFAVPGWGILWSIAAWAVAFLSAFVLFLAIYRVVPNAGQRLSEVWPGALLAAVLFFALSQLFPLYVHYFGAYGKYAAFGLLFLVMIWFYFLAQVLLLGVELNAFLYRPWLRQATPSVAAAEVVGNPVEVVQTSLRGQPNVVKRLLFAILSIGLSWAVLALALAAMWPGDDEPA